MEPIKKALPVVTSFFVRIHMRTASQSRNARGGKYSRGGLWQPKDSAEGTDEVQADAPPFWEGSVATFQSWLSHNPLRLGIDDHAVSLIQGEICRGNDDASARLRCYMHIGKSCGPSKRLRCTVVMLCWF